MAYEAYVTTDEYERLFPDGVSVTDADLRTASRHVDTLTFNRIVSLGFSNLTEFQQGVVKEVVCRQAAFEVENADVIQSVLSSYSINGVSMQFGSNWNVFAEDGIAMQRETYALLEQTGLCCRLAR